MTLSNRAVTHLQALVTGLDTHERYELLEVVGRGGMGVVYRAHDRELARDVALKFIESPGAMSSDAAERLRREAGILAQLEHPGIVAVHDIGTFADGRAFYVMRLVRGQRLDEHVATGLSRSDVLRIMLRLCETVAYANDRGVIHRDLKPGNVMIGPFGEVLVLDWGVAKILQSVHDSSDATPLQAANRNVQATLDGMIVGTPGYMSPEQESGSSAQVDQTADVFALGVILRELLASANTATHQHDEHSAPNPNTRALDAIVSRATAATPASRYRSAVQLAADITHWMDGQPVAAYREGPVERVLRFGRKHQTAILLIVTYLVVRTVILRWRNI